MALVAPLLALAGMLALHPLDGRYPFLLFFPAVILVALYFGLWPGLLATVLSWNLAELFIIEPARWLPAGTEDALAGAVFVGIGITFSLMAKTLRRTQRSLIARDRELRASEARYCHALSVLPAAVYTTDLDGRITLFNPAAAELWGREPVIGKDLWCGSWRIFRPDGTPLPLEQCPMAVALREGRAVRDQEIIIERPDGRRVHILPHPEPLFDENGAVVGAINMLIDVTEHRTAEEELRRHREELEKLVAERTAELADTHERLRITERMVMIGTLASGLGHDLANLLMPIRLCVDSLAKKGLDDAAREMLDPIRKSTDYLRTLSNALRQLAHDPMRAGTGGARTVLHEWWPEVEPIMRAVLRRHLSLEVQVPDNLPTVALANHQLTQAVFNLVQNAADAMRECERGRVTIAFAEESGQVIVRVSDTGPGMADEVRRRCLEPFFTTKTRGLGGTGMGLALVHSIVTSVGGTVDIQSKPGEGTTFVLRLPPFDAQSAAHAPAESAGKLTAVITVRDPQTRGFAQSMLRAMNFELIEPGLNGCSRVSVWLTGDPAEARILAGDGHQPHAERVVLFDDSAEDHPRIRIVGRRPKPMTLRDTLREISEKQPVGTNDNAEPANLGPMRG